MFTFFSYSENFKVCEIKKTEEFTKDNDKVILHAWSWSFNTIANNMKDIAASGYDYVQTSPANTCFVGEDGGMALFSQPGDSIKGKWYYYYQQKVFGEECKRCANPTMHKNYHF